MAKPIAKVSQLMSKFNANMAQENTHCRDFATSFLCAATTQLILWLAPAVSNEGGSSELLVPLPVLFGPGFRLGDRWNRLGETVKTRKKRAVAWRL